MRRSAPCLALSLALGACSAFGWGGEAEVGLTVVLPPEKAQALDFTVDVGGRTFGRDDFRPAGERQFDAGPVEVDARSTRVACIVSSGAANTTGTLLLDLQSDWRYRVNCAVASENPERLCMGCRGSRSFGLSPALGFAPGDSLYLVWGGDPTDGPPLY